MLHTAEVVSCCIFLARRKFSATLDLGILVGLVPATNSASATHRVFLRRVFPPPRPAAVSFARATTRVSRTETRFVNKLEVVRYVANGRTKTLARKLMWLFRIDASRIREPDVSLAPPTGKRCDHRFTPATLADLYPVPPPNHTDNNHGRRKAEEARGLRPHGGQGHDEAVRSHVF
jgi:hypothetical protein